MASNDLRLRGQEVELRLVVDGTVEANVTLFSSMDETMKLEKKEDGFLGETTNRYDHIFNGYDGKLKCQLNSSDYQLYANKIKAQAQRKTPGTVFNIVRTDYYANGQTLVKTYLDCKFGPAPTSVGGRGEFVTFELDFSCSDTDEQFLNQTL